MLEIDGLHKRFGDTVALDGLTFAVRRGEMFGFVGTNGAGKTTAMRIVLGVLAADDGVVRWEGRELDAAARARIGYMPEERGLYPKMRVRDHLVYLARLHGAEPSAAGAAADRWLAALAVDGRAGDRVEALSLGNQQRVQLAAALVHDPMVLVLDEPFSGLDPVGVDVLAGVLRERVDAGAAVVFSSHQLDLVERICDRVGIVRQGRMVAVGTVEELRASGNEELVVHAPKAAPGWTDGLPGVTVIEQSGDRTRLELGDAADDQAILRAALATGPVHEFARRRPTLTELFRHVVSQPEEER